jgi:exopolysaccharide biosynthesis polyprenyl glycosylphosphotransferase
MNLVQYTAEPAFEPGFMIGGIASESEPFCRVRPFPDSAAQRRIVLYISLFTFDLLCILAGFMLAGELRLGSPLEEQALRTLAIVLPAFTAIALNGGAYSIDALHRPFLGARKSAHALLCASAGAVGLLFYFKAGVQFSRLIFAAGTLLSLLFNVSGRILLGAYIGRLHRWTFTNELVIADQVTVKASARQKIVSAALLGLEPRADDPLLLDRLSVILENCDRVVVACPPERRAGWTRTMKGTNVSVEVCIPELTSIGAIGLGNFGGEATAVVSCGPLNLRDRVLKRTLDVTVALGGLFLLAPVMLLTAAAVAIESRGPIFFRQDRVGQNNRIFKLVKFRSMRMEHSDGPGHRSVSIGDGRLTRVGRFIRSTSIDELPQLFNVLTGDMSIVGPRPHALGSTAENETFWQIDSNYFDRHATKPGITGLAQIRGFRGPTRARKDLTGRLRADIEYLAEWSIWRDVRIICATFRVLIHPNAY